MKAKIKFSFSRYTDSELETKAEFILQSMTGNPNFPNPIPTLADLQIALTVYSAALVNAENRSNQTVVDKNQARLVLEGLLGQLAMYVMYLANGDISILTSSGFSTTKVPEPKIIDNPGQVTLTNGKSTGELISYVKAVDGAKSYSHQITTGPVTAASVWTNVTSSRSKMLFTDLQPGKLYCVRIEAVGSQNQTALSPVSSMFVQ